MLRLTSSKFFQWIKRVLINLDLLEKKHLELQMTFHPNKFISLSKKEIEISNKYSSKINEAYNTLKNNVNRINLILMKSGVSIINHNETYKNSELLEDIMEIQEEFMFAEIDNKKKIKERIKKLIDEILLDTEELYKKGDYNQMLNNSIRLSYLSKILN